MRQEDRRSLLARCLDYKSLQGPFDADFRAARRRSRISKHATARIVSKKRYLFSCRRRRQAISHFVIIDKLIRISSRR